MVIAFPHYTFRYLITKKNNMISIKKERAKGGFQVFRQERF